MKERSVARLNLTRLVAEMNDDVVEDGTIYHLIQIVFDHVGLVSYPSRLPLLLLLCALQ